jgi:SLOG in TRPM
MNRFPVPTSPVEYNFGDGLAAGQRQNFLDPHHTHFLLVDDGSSKYGGEIDFRAKFESRKRGASKRVFF